METYKEYPIRCKTCNEQLACFAADYEALVEAGATEEEALNDLGITEYCSRIALTNPTIVSFNMENREVIEGFKSVDAATEADAQNESMTRPVFNPCLGAQPTLAMGIMGIQPGRLDPGVPFAGLLPGVTGQAAPRIGAIQGLTLATGVPRPTTITFPTQPGPSVGVMGTQPGRLDPGVPFAGLTLGRVPPNVPGAQPGLPVGVMGAQPRPAGGIMGGLQTRTHPAPVRPATQADPQIVAPIIPGIELDDIETLGVGIPVAGLDITKVAQFQEPVAVGVPTINPDPAVPQLQVYVGAGKYIHVLNGRTYLAQ